MSEEIQLDWNSWFTHLKEDVTDDPMNDDFINKIINSGLVDTDDEEEK